MNSISRLFIILSLGSLSCIWLWGCRIPKLFIPPPDKVLFYDTSYEKEIADRPAPEPGSLADDYRWRYRDSLAEPVTNISWDAEEESTWKILFATNRVPNVIENKPDIHFNNRFAQKLHFGSCEVRLSHNEPKYEEPQGDDVKSKLTRVLPVAWQKELAHDESKIAKVQAIREAEQPQFYSELKDQLQRSRQKDVLLFVHGFNVSFDSAVIRLAQLTKDMPFNGAVVAYSWPSQGGIANYPVDGEVVDQSVKPFTQFLNQLATQLPPETRINIVVHSMGNRLVLRALQDVKVKQGARKPFANIVFCAPDVGVKEFKEKAPRVVALAERVTLYTCLNDSALIASSKINKEDRAGSTLPPTVVDGIETVECAILDTSLMGHSYYGSNRSILRDLFCIVKEHKSAAERGWLKEQDIPLHEPYYIFTDFPLNLEWGWHFDEASDQKGPSVVKTAEFSQR